MTADPDSRARTHLANERTFLAWFRTGLTLVALGLAAGQFLDRDVEPGSVGVPLFATLVIGTGMLLVTVGVYRYVRGVSRIDAERYQPARTSVVVTSAAAVVTGILAIALVWLISAR